MNKQLRKHGLLSDKSDSSSSRTDSYFDDTDSSSKSGDSKKKKKHKHKKRSGINAKASDKVRHPQKWTHSHLHY